MENIMKRPFPYQKLAIGILAMIVTMVAGGQMMGAAGAAPIADPRDYGNLRVQMLQWLRLMGKLENPNDATVEAVSGMFDWNHWNEAKVDEFKRRRYLASYRTQVVELGKAPMPATFFYHLYTMAQFSQYDFKTKSFHVLINPDSLGLGFTSITVAGKTLYGVSSPSFKACTNGICPPFEGVWNRESVLVYSNVKGPIRFDVQMPEETAEGLLDHLRHHESSMYLDGDKPQMGLTFVSGPPDSAEDGMRIQTFPISQRFPVNLLYTRLQQIELSVGEGDKRTSFATLDFKD
jgi:hypothetical protein